MHTFRDLVSSHRILPRFVCAFFSAAAAGGRARDALSVCGRSPILPPRVQRAGLLLPDWGPRGTARDAESRRSGGFGWSSVVDRLRS